MVTIRNFETRDQEAAKSLILAGLVEHWGWLDPDKNPDLNDIAASYACGTFLTAWEGEDLVGTGALIPEGDQTARIVRMSVASRARRRGVASTVLKSLIEKAKATGCRQIVLETNTTWENAIEFYRHHGFILDHEADGESHFFLDLN